MKDCWPPFACTLNRTRVFLSRVLLLQVTEMQQELGELLYGVQAELLCSYFGSKNTPLQPRTEMIRRYEWQDGSEERNEEEYQVKLAQWISQTKRDHECIYSAAHKAVKCCQCTTFGLTDHCVARSAGLGCGNICVNYCKLLPGCLARKELYRHALHALCHLVHQICQSP